LHVRKSYFSSQKECQTFAQKTKLELHIKKIEKKKNTQIFWKGAQQENVLQIFLRYPKHFSQILKIKKLIFLYLYIYMLAMQKYVNEALKHKKLNYLV
jgi:hypothetical protein